MYHQSIKSTNTVPPTRSRITTMVNLPFKFFLCHCVSYSRHTSGGIYYYNMTLLTTLTKQRVPYNRLSSQCFPTFSIFSFHLCFEWKIVNYSQFALMHTQQRLITLAMTRGDGF